MKKKWLIALSVLVLLVPLSFVASLGVLYYKQEALVQRALAAINEQFDGELVLAGSRIAPFANFPYISVDLQGLRFYADKTKQGEPLYSVDDLYLGFDFNAITSGRYEVKSLKLSGCTVNAVRDSAGLINILSVKRLQQKTEADTERKPIALDLKSVKVSRADIHFQDSLANMEYRVALDQLSAAFSMKGEAMDIGLDADMVLGIWAAGRPTFFQNKHLVIDAQLSYDQEAGFLDVLLGQLELSEAVFELAGSIDLVNDMDMQLTVMGNKPDFSLLAAFSPPEVEAALSAYQNAGRVYFLGKIAGKAGGGHRPSIQVDFGCEQAYFLNKSSNAEIKDLNFKGSFTNGAGRNLSSSVLELTNFYAKPEEGVFQGRLLIRNFLDPFIRVNLHADLDLAFLSRFFQIEGLQYIKGKILLDMDFDELIDLDLPGEQLAQLKKGIDSELKLKGLQFTLPGYPHQIKDLNGSAVMKDGRVEMDSLSFHIGGSDFWVQGSLSDLPALFHRFDTLISIDVKLRADRIALPELLAFDTLLSAAYDETITGLNLHLAFEAQASELYGFAHLPKGEFFIKDAYAQFEHYPHKLHDVHADILITEQSLSIVDFRGEIDRSDFRLSGGVDNYPKWFQDAPRGDSHFAFELQSEQLRLNDLLTYKGVNYLPEAYQDEVFRALDIKGKLDLHYQDSFQSADLYLERLNGRMSAHPLKLEGFKGRAHYEDGRLLIDRCSGRMGQSDFLVSMSWQTGPGHAQADNYLFLQSEVLDLDLLLDYKGPEQQVDHEAAFNIFDLPFPKLRVEAKVGRMNYHRYWLEQVDTKLRLQEDHYLYIDTLSVLVAKGGLKLKGYFNGSNSANIYFHSDIEADNLDIDKLMVKFDNFGQDQLINERLHGNISGTISSTFRMHPDLTPIMEESEAKMELSVTEGSLVRFAPMLALSDYFKDKNLNLVRFDTLYNTLDLKDGVLSIPKMNINSSLGFMELSGRQHLDLSMDYFMRIPLKMVTQVGWQALFKRRQSPGADAAQVDEIQYRDESRKMLFLNLQVTGTADNYEVSLGKDRGRE